MKNHGMRLAAALLMLATGCGVKPPTGGSATPAATPPGGVAYALGDRRLTTFAVDANGGWTQVSAVPEDGMSAALQAHRPFLFVGRSGQRRSTATGYSRVADVAAYGIVSGGLASASITAIGDYDFAQVLAHPAGRFLYLGDQSFPGLAVGVVDPTTGTIGGQRFVDGAPTANAVFDPTGRHLYAIAGSSAPDPALLGYAVDEATGRLAPIGTQAEGTLVAMHPTGCAVYVARSDGDVLAYARDAASGELRLVGRAAGEAGPTQLAVDARGRWLYVSTSRVTAYALDPTAAFAGASSSAAARGRLAVDPDGRFLYVGRQDAPEIVAISTDGVALGSPRTVAALHAAWIAIAPSP
jgi:hypothetical protein